MWLNIASCEDQSILVSETVHAVPDHPLTVPVERPVTSTLPTREGHQHTLKNWNSESAGEVFSRKERYCRASRVTFTKRALSSSTYRTFSNMH